MLLGVTLILKTFHYYITHQTLHARRDTEITSTNIHVDPRLYRNIKELVNGINRRKLVVDNRKFFWMYVTELAIYEQYKKGYFFW